MMRLACIEDAENYDFIPRTFIFPQDSKEFAEYQKRNKGAVYISKPNAGCMGDGIKLF